MTVPMTVLNNLCEEGGSWFLYFIHLGFFFCILACNMISYQLKLSTCQHGLLDTCEPGCMHFCGHSAFCVITGDEICFQKSVFACSEFYLQSVILWEVLFIQFGLYLEITCWLTLDPWRMVSTNLFCLSLGFLILLSVKQPFFGFQ